MSRASTSRLAPGEHSIDRTKPRSKGAGKGKIFYLDWSVRLHDDRLLRRRTQGSTQQEVKRRAKQTAAELLTAGPGAAWSMSSPIVDYVEAVSRPAIEGSSLRPTSKRRYLQSLDTLLGASTIRRTYSLKGHTIAGFTKSFTTMERTLQEISSIHGTATARTAKTVLSGYILGRLLRDGLIDANRLRGESISGVDQKSPKRGGRALSKDEYLTVVDHLLQRDPEAVRFPGGNEKYVERGVTKAKHTVTILLTLLQASTGLRISEANGITWTNITITEDDALITVTADLSKTRRGRTVPVLLPEVADLLRKRHRDARPTDFLIGSPRDSSKRWDEGNCRDAVAAFYSGLASELDIPLLEEFRSHVWRATLNTITSNQLSPAQRAAYFGHSENENQKSYTDLTDVSGMSSALADIRKTTRKTTLK